MSIRPAVPTGRFVSAGPWHRSHLVVACLPRSGNRVCAWSNDLAFPSFHPASVWHDSHVGVAGFFVNCPLWGSAWQSLQRENFTMWKLRETSDLPAAFDPAWHFSQRTAACLPFSGKRVDEWSKLRAGPSFHPAGVWHSLQGLVNRPACGSRWHELHSENSIWVNRTGEPASVPRL